MLVNFGNHPDAVGDSLISGDWPTLLRHRLEKALDNVKSIFFICQSILAYMIREKIQGHIVNVCSEMSYRPIWYPYGVSKWGLRGLTGGLGRLMAPYGITVNGVAPGQTATEMMCFKPGDPLDEPSIPRGIMSTPEEIASVIHFLASEEAKNIMGEIVISDGARHLY